MALGGDGLGARADRCAPISGVPRIENDKAGIIDPAVGVFKAERILARL
jgi:hypothetical protein